jgi:hypothetical protein
MRANPCRKLEAEFKQAALEFLEADKDIKSLSKSPILQAENMEISPKDREQLTKAVERLEKTREKLSCINQELLKCKKGNPI